MSKQVYGSLVRGNKKLQGERLKEGPCIFPFKFKGEMQNECIKGKKGEWCATEINNEDERKMVKYAFCDYDHKPKVKKTKVKKEPSKAKSPKKNSPTAAPAPAPAKKPSENKAAPAPAPAKKPSENKAVPAPAKKPSEKKKILFKPKKRVEAKIEDPSAEIDKVYRLQILKQCNHKWGIAY